MLGILEDSSFFQTLQSFDEDICEAARQSGCGFCEGHLDSSHYMRKPRGIEWAAIDAQSMRRFSLCCRSAGCRKRTTPMSLRFAGRKVYCSLFILLYVAVNESRQDQSVNELHRRFGLSRETGRRWIRIFTCRLTQSRWWKSRSGLKVFLMDGDFRIFKIFQIIGVASPPRDAWLLFLQFTETLWPELI